MSEAKPEFPSLSQPKVARPRSAPEARFGLLAWCCFPLVLGVGFGLAGPSAPALLIAAGGYGVGVWLATSLLRRGFDHPTLGACNAVTLVRLALTSALLAAVVTPVASGWVVCAVAAISLMLDGMDGWLARREGRCSDFGARFDMEVDAAFGLILAAYLWAAGAAGPLVLLLGLPRYVFAAAGQIWPWLLADLPPRFGRKVVCVIQIGSLIALIPQVLAPVLAQTLVAGAALALVWSFGRDVIWLWRNRA